MTMPTLPLPFNFSHNYTVNKITSNLNEPSISIIASNFKNNINEVKRERERTVTHDSVTGGFGDMEIVGPSC